jgi:hypothetical protein
MKMIFFAALCSSVVALVVRWKYTCPIFVRRKNKKKIDQSTAKAGPFLKFTVAFSTRA